MFGKRALAGESRERPQRFGHQRALSLKPRNGDKERQLFPAWDHDCAIAGLLAESVGLRYHARTTIRAQIGRCFTARFCSSEAHT
jgi:hypothetical protein